MSDEMCESAANVLCERPGGERAWTPETALVLWIALALGISTLVGLAVANWLSTKATRGASNGANADRQPI